MKKKLNLVLRDPVRLHETTASATTLPSPFARRNISERELQETENAENTQVKELKEIPGEVVEPKIKEVRATKPELAKVETKPKKPVTKEIITKTETLPKSEKREKMSPRVQQIWDYFCQVARKTETPQKIFNVTRAEVMREAGIGSTNTYRDALEKFRQLGVIEIEVRPGVNAGSIFRFTDEGWREAGFSE